MRFQSRRVTRVRKNENEVRSTPVSSRVSENPLILLAVKLEGGLKTLNSPALRLSQVTFGITCFDRPEHLKRLVQSIRMFYPEARVVVADNGLRSTPVPFGVRYLRLPVDCGLSAARNALIDALDTDLMLLLEEDFQFADETCIEKFLDILDHDEEVGFVGGSVYQEGRKLEYAVDLHRFRDTLHLEPSRRDTRVTPTGTTYRHCDMCLNFGLFRREMLREHRWPEDLKLGEHAAYFEAVREAARWRVAHTDQVRIRHDRTGRSETYRRHRGRSSSMLQEGLRRRGLSRMRANPELASGLPENGLSPKPNIVVLGVGHSGTSILSKMLFAAGWEAGDADDEFGESVGIRSINQEFLKVGQFPAGQATVAMFRKEPWVVKDPRFVLTLERWRHVFAQLPQPPLLIWLRRDSKAVAASYVRRGRLTQERAEELVGRRYIRAEEQYAAWPWRKVALDYEKIRAAVGLFDTRRSASIQEDATSGPMFEVVAALAGKEM
ncbi:MAG: glycosyltransferase [Planctomycetes bacterium]|nr:glycosyltransferase [Planctomycetota bacterium]